MFLKRQKLHFFWHLSPFLGSQLLSNCYKMHQKSAFESLYPDLLHTNYYYSNYPVSSNNWKVARGVTKNRCLKYTSSLRVWKVIHGCAMTAEKSTRKSVMHEPSSCFACFKLSYYCLKLWAFSIPPYIVSDIIGAVYAYYQPGPGCSNVR